MTDYTKLVKALRHCKVDYCSSCLGCPMYADYEGSGCINEMHDSAAAAIEDLQAVLKEADKKQAYQHDYICELVAENEELQAETERLKAQLPKRGQYVHGGELPTRCTIPIFTMRRSVARCATGCPSSRRRRTHDRRI